MNVLFSLCLLCRCQNYYQTMLLIMLPRKHRGPQSWPSMTFHVAWSHTHLIAVYTLFGSVTLISMFHCLAIVHFAMCSCFWSFSEDVNFIIFYVCNSAFIKCCSSHAFVFALILWYQCLTEIVSLFLSPAFSFPNSPFSPSFP